MELWVKEPCEHGELSKHRTPDENSYAAMTTCPGGYCRKASPAELVAAMKTLPGVTMGWRCVHGNAICESVTPQLRGKRDPQADPHTECGPVVVVPTEGTLEDE